MLDQAVRSMSHAKLESLVSTAQKISQSMDGLFAESGYKSVLLCPSQPRRAPLHRAMLLSANNFLYTGWWNALGLPACVVPLGLGAAGLPLHVTAGGASTVGLPVSVQLVGAEGCDALLAAVAVALEKRFGGWRST